MNLLVVKQAESLNIPEVILIMNDRFVFIVTSFLKTGVYLDGSSEVEILFKFAGQCLVRRIEAELLKWSIHFPLHEQPTPLFSCF